MRFIFDYLVIIYVLNGFDTGGLDVFITYNLYPVTDLTALLGIGAVPLHGLPVSNTPWWPLILSV